MSSVVYWLNLWAGFHLDGKMDVDNPSYHVHTPFKREKYYLLWLSFQINNTYFPEKSRIITFFFFLVSLTPSKSHILSLTDLWDTVLLRVEVGGAEIHNKNHCTCRKGKLNQYIQVWKLKISIYIDNEYRTYSSVQFSGLVVSDALRLHELQHTRAPCPSPTPRAYPNSCPLSRRCHPAMSSSVIPFFSCPQSLPASGSFQMSQLFTSGGQSIEVSALSVLSMNIKDWSPLGWTGWISLQSKGLSRVFSNTTVQKHQFFSAQLSL